MFIIVAIMAVVLEGQSVNLNFQYATSFPTMEQCEAVRIDTINDSINDLKKQVEDRYGKVLKVESKCIELGEKD
jgi:molybdopterin-biosynthesis enzyme MoeA-like protein